MTPMTPLVSNHGHQWSAHPYYAITLVPHIILFGTSSHTTSSRQARALPNECPGFESSTQERQLKQRKVEIWKQVASIFQNCKKERPDCKCNKWLGRNIV